MMRRSRLAALRLADAQGTITSTALAQSTHDSLPAAAKILERCVDAGHLTIVGGLGRSRDPYRYRLTDSGKAFVQAHPAEPPTLWQCWQYG